MVWWLGNARGFKEDDFRGVKNRIDNWLTPVIKMSILQRNVRNTNSPCGFRRKYLIGVKRKDALAIRRNDGFLMREKDNFSSTMLYICTIQLRLHIHCIHHT